MVDTFSCLAVTNLVHQGLVSCGKPQGHQLCLPKHDRSNGSCPVKLLANPLAQTRGQLHQKMEIAVSRATEERSLRTYADAVAGASRAIWVRIARMSSCDCRVQ